MRAARRPDRQRSRHRRLHRDLESRQDEDTGFSTCTTSGYVGFAVGGFAVGALVGYLIK
jgi:hypothetical protein